MEISRYQAQAEATWLHLEELTQRVESLEKKLKERTHVDRNTFELVDCHCHLYSPVFSEDLESVLRNAQAVGVSKFITVSESLKDAKNILKLSQKYASIKPCAGLHPIQNDKCVQLEDLPNMLSFISSQHQDLVAIGEVGLDFSPRIASSAEQKKIQRIVLEEQIKLALEYQLPINVHSRSAGKPTIDLIQSLMSSSRQVPILLHAFDGRASIVKSLCSSSLPFYFSVPPNILRCSGFEGLVQAAPLERLVIETDSPALAIEKGSRNEPKYAVASCEEVARIKVISKEEVARITTENAKRIFPKAFL